MMTETGDHHHNNKPHRRKRPCLIAIVVFLFVILLLFIIALILALTVFKTKQPTTQILSATVDGLEPRLSFPAIKTELNITLDLVILVQNRNPASFKHGAGNTFLLYQGNQVGVADLYPGLIPARGNATLPCRLTLQANRVADNMGQLVSDVLDGEFALETRTRIPGRVTLLGFIKKHIVSASECQLSIGFPDLKVKRQQCESKTKL